MASVRPMASSDTIPVSLLRTSERNRSGTVVSARVPWMDRSSDIGAFYGVGGRGWRKRLAEEFEVRSSNEEFRIASSFFILHSYLELRTSIPRTITVNAASPTRHPRSNPH